MALRCRTFSCCGNLKNANMVTDTNQESRSLLWNVYLAVLYSLITTLVCSQFIACIILVIGVTECLVQYFVIILKATHKQCTACTETLHNSVDCECCWTRVDVALKVQCTYSKVRGLTTGMATLPQSNQESLVVREKAGRPQVSLG